MKTILAFVICVFSVTTLLANDEAYIKAMKKNIQALNEAQTKEQLLEVANAFERIANRTSTDWLPLYYAGMAYIQMSSMESSTSTKDAVLDKGRTFVDKALKIAPNESEVVLLDGYWTMLKLSADPASRGQSLSPKVMQLFGKAMQMNPQNPRAYLMMAQMEYGTAQFFGHSTEKACGLAKKSLDLFSTSNEADGIKPNWGKDSVQKMTQMCK